MKDRLNANGVDLNRNWDNNWEPVRRFAEGYSKASGYPIPESSLVGYRITGASTGYFRSLGIPAMVVELAGRGDPEFEKNLRGIEAVLELLAGRKGE